MKILIADDDPITRTLIVENLISWGYEPVTAENGLVALHQLQKANAPKLAILDWQMPGMTGFEICQKMNAQSEITVPYIIMLTSLGDKMHLVKGLEAGANDYLAKPFNPYELRVRIQNACRMINREIALLAEIERLKKLVDA